MSGYVKGVGTFDNVTFAGTFSPGFSPTTSYVGNVGFASTNTLVMEIGGTTAGSQYDQLISSGQLTLGGTLQLSLISGFTPAAGQSFNLFDWQSLVGTFSSLSSAGAGRVAFVGHVATVLDGHCKCCRRRWVAGRFQQQWRGRRGGLCGVAQGCVGSIDACQLQFMACEFRGSRGEWGRFVVLGGA